MFVACFGKDYDAYIARDIEAMSRYHATGSGSSMLANRISHAYDLRGPSITVDTACSAGLSAFHLACQSLRHGESDAALVAAGNTYMTPESLTIPLDDAGFLSPEGRCRSFDAGADGYARGEGFGAVLVKPLRAALRDGDLVRAVVRATGASQDGRTPVITQPSAEAQVRLIRRTYAAAGLDLRTTAYVEAHGTGTPTGDPVEASSIGEAFGAHRRDGDPPLYVGSVKSNIGHLEGASGLAGIIKTVLVLENGVIPPICNFETVNPAIDHERLRLAFPARAVPWPSTGLRRASVSSFGYGGSNGHAVLDDAGNYLRLRGLDGLHKSVDLSSGPVGSPPPSTTALSAACSTTSGEDGASSPASSAASLYPTARRGILPLSAADEDGPARLAGALASYLASEAGRAASSSSSSLGDILHTLSAHRTQHPWRTFAVVGSAHDLEAAAAAGLRPAARAHHVAPSLHFAFTGQGAQWPRMGLGLMHLAPFRAALEAADSYLRGPLGCEWSLLSQLERTAGDDDGGGSTIGRPALAQPLTTALQVALVDLMSSWGIAPASVVGHSSGEIAAAYCAGAISREEAWRIAYYRGVVSEKLLHPAAGQGPKTGMLSVGLGAEAAQTYLAEEGLADAVTVACVNSPINVTLSGRVEALDRLYERFEEDELFVRRLDVPIAYHHRAVMSEVAEEYERMLSEGGLEASLVSGSEAHQHHPISFYSSVTAEAVADHGELRKPSYWVNNLTSPVQFAAAVGCVVQQPAAKSSRNNRSYFFVEMGPQAALRRPLQDSLSALLGSRDKWHYANLLDARGEDISCLLGAIGQLWCSGVDADLAAVNKACSSASVDPPPRMVPDLPSYPFSRARLDWAESRLSRRFAFRPHRRHALLGLAARDWNAGEASWRHIIRAAENPWILDHTINGTSVYPGAGMIVMAVEGARQLMGDAKQGQKQEQHQQRILGYRVVDVRFLRSIPVDDTERGVEAQLQMRQRRDDINNTLQKWYDWRVFTLDGDEEWAEAARGSIKVETETVAGTGTDDAAAQASASEVRRKREADKTRAEYDGILEACKFKTYPDQMYANIRSQGMDYGPYFARLTDIYYDKDGRAAASLRTRDYADRMAYAAEDPCVVHPTTLDALCHLQMVSVSAGGLRPMPAMLFTHCRELWISHALLDLPRGAGLVAASAETMRGFRERECDTVALHAETREPVVVIRGERGTAVASLDRRGRGRDADADADAACYQISFRPDLSLMTDERSHRFLMDNTFRGFALPSRDCIDNVDALALQYVEKTLRRLEQEEEDDAFRHPTDHLVQYIDWMKRLRRHRHEYTLESRGREDVSEEELMSAATTEPTQLLVHRVGQNLYDILTGRANALQILFEGSLMQGESHLSGKQTSSDHEG